MRGKGFKDSTMSKMSTKESPMQIVFDHSPPHPEITSIFKNPNQECRDEVNKNPNDTSTSQSGITCSKDEIVPEQVYPNTTLVPHKSTWLIDFVEHLWKE